MATDFKEDVKWSTEHSILRGDERRSGSDRRQLNGRSITVPDMSSNDNRRSGDERREKIRLTITGRALNV